MFSFLSLNARSLLNKLDELPALASNSCTSPPSVIAVTETWCSTDEPDTFYNMHNYTTHRCDRTTGRGGGSILYIHNLLPHRRLDMNMPGFESVWIQIDTPDVPVTVCSVYRPPSTDPHDFCAKLETCIRSIRVPNEPLILLGDFNAHHSNWLERTKTDTAGDCLQQLLTAYDLAQHVDFPTHILHGTPASCIDLVISNLQDYTISLRPGPTLGNSDHLSIHGKIDLPAQYPAIERDPRPVWSWNWSPECIAALKGSLRSDPLLPMDPQQEQSCESMWSTWRSRLLKRAHLFCTASRFEDRYPPRSLPTLRRPWMSPELLAEIKLKHRLYRDYTRSRDETLWKAFTRQRNLTSTLMRKAKSDFVLRTTSTSNTTQLEPTTHALSTPNTTTQHQTSPLSQPSVSPPKLHQLMKRLKVQQRKQLPDLHHNNVTHSTPADKATALNEFFIAESRKSVGNSDEPIPPIVAPEVTDDHLTNILTTPEEVCTILRSLDSSKSAGDDGIPTRLLKEVASEICTSLSFLFNLSFTRGELPQMWREATITPVHKKGTQTSPTNYRPISLISVIAKVQERIVHKRLYAHVEPHLPNEQSGFRKKDGTELQLLRLVHEISAAKDNGDAVSACFFDLSKAFDRVWHKGLLEKLKHLGVRSQAHDWISSYLCNRRQRVRVADTTSPWLPIPAGVPQGSVLGPLLFLIYTYDLPTSCTNTHTKCSQFADDTALITTHKDPVQAQEHLQQAITSAGAWLQSWHLLVNAGKTVVMSFQRTQTLQLTLHKTTLKQVSSHRHLGLTIQSDLRWNEHVQTKISKAQRSLAILMKIRGTIHTNALTLIYTTYIRPILEYATLATSNMTTTLQDKLERFQRRACRVCLRLPMFQPVNHTSLLFQLSLDTLSSRRHYRQVTLAHTLHMGTVPPHLLNPHFCPLAKRPTIQLRRTRTYELPTTKTTRHRDSPINIALCRYNNLPADIREIKSIALFKKSVSPLILSSTCSCSSHLSISFSN